MTRDVPPLVEHFERYLGPIQKGARLRDDVQGVSFRDRPVAGATTFATLGLSNHALTQSRGPSVRAEFLIACRDDWIDAFPALSVLADVTDETAASHVAPARGTVIGPRGRFFPQSDLAALYCSTPAYFDDGIVGFSGFHDPFVLIWLVPIAPLEAAYISTHGWSAFEERLSESDADLLDMTRPVVVDHA